MVVGDVTLGRRLAFTGALAAAPGGLDGPSGLGRVLEPSGSTGGWAWFLRVVLCGGPATDSSCAGAALSLARPYHMDAASHTGV
jgi:hypothetical protein